MMSTDSQQQLLFAVLVLLSNIQLSMEDMSISSISTLGQEFIPADSSYLPLTFTTERFLYCHMECNKRTSCRTFDYDATSKQCRLWGADTTTGSIVASPSKPQSSVGTIRLIPSIYQNIHNQSCDRCVQSRYEVCDTTTNTCQCPSNTYWNGSMCLALLFRNQTCSQADACRSDLNLTCQPRCDFTYRCTDLPAIGVGQTVVGYRNATGGTSSSAVQGPWGIYVSPDDGTLYVADYDLGRTQSFSAYSRTGQVLLSNGTAQAIDIFADSLGTIYMTSKVNSGGTLYIQRAGVTIMSMPTPGLSTSACKLNGLYTAAGVAVDKSGSIYIALTYCYVVVKWTINATNGTVVSGQPGIYGSNSTTLDFTRFIHLDEARNTLYVADNGNHRVQKFTIGGNGTGITVAGGNGAGTGLNQLNDPGGIWVTRDGQTLYIADYLNNRVMKWAIGASQGSLVAGSTTGVAGNTALLLNGPGDVALDPTESYLYVSDYGNHRIQRFRIR